MPRIKRLVPEVSGCCGCSVFRQGTDLVCYRCGAVQWRFGPRNRQRALKELRWLVDEAGRLVLMYRNKKLAYVRPGPEGQDYEWSMQGGIPQALGLMPEGKQGLVRVGGFGSLLSAWLDCKKVLRGQSRALPDWVYPSEYHRASNLLGAAMLK